MAIHQAEQFLSFPAGADLSGAQYHFVKLSSGSVVLCGAGEAGIGVLQNAPTSGQAAKVQVSGVTPVVLGATTSAGEVMSAADGEAIAATSTNFILGEVVEGGDDQEQVSLLLQNRGPKA